MFGDSRHEVEMESPSMLVECLSGVCIIKVIAFSNRAWSLRAVKCRLPLGASA
jgi:hypothetical protein